MAQEYKREKEAESWQEISDVWQPLHTSNQPFLGISSIRHFFSKSLKCGMPLMERIARGRWSF
eukprot:3478134-Prorocentrum_lima.AAC.1